ncbi:MAG: hypothetical protein ACREJT_12495, partial [Myxococcota bacterium]
MRRRTDGACAAACRARREISMNRLSACAVGACLAVTTAFAAPPPGETPLTLRRAIAAAQAGNPELQAYPLLFRAQDARIAAAGLRPATTASVEVENLLGSGSYRAADGAEFTFGLSQVIELGGKREARVAGAQ